MARFPVFAALYDGKDSMQLRNNMRQFDASFWRYLTSFFFFSVGVFIFAELYPLYLQDYGYSVVVLGNASLALNVGSIVGTVPAVFLMRWLGLKETTVVSLAGASLASAARLWHESGLMVYGGAFAAGFFFAVLTVGIAVTVSRLTTPANRALGFSWFFGVTISAGFLGDAIGGELPGLIGRLAGFARSADAMLGATILACALSLASVIPAMGLRYSSDAQQHETISIPRDAPIVRMMVAIAIWNFAVGLFAPFYAVYFSTYLGESVRTIGLDLASGQIVGAVFTMFAPAFIAARGAVGSVRFMMFFAGACAFFLSLASTTIAVGIGYAIYMGFVAMAQVPLQTLLMNRVRTEEQAGASMLNSLVVFSAVATGAFIGGHFIFILGFPQLLALAGACCMLAAVVFVVMVKADPEPGKGAPMSSKVGP